MRTPAIPDRLPISGHQSIHRNFFPFHLLWFSLVALELAYVADLRITEGDIWFHLRNAQHFLATHSVLRTDLYTFTIPGAPLLDHEWLSELPYYLAFQTWGLGGILAIYFSILFLVFAALYYLALRRGANPGGAALVTMVGVALGSYSIGPHMHHFGWFCMAVLLLVLQHFEDTGRGLWLLPPLFLLWINLHGSWVFGFVVMGAYIVSGLLEGHWNTVVAQRWSSQQLRKLLLATAASAVALFANPYGYKLVWYPFDLLFRQKINLNNMGEWLSVDFHTGWGKLAMFMLIALLAAIWFSPKPWQLHDVLLAIFAVWASLNHVRFLLFAAIILVPILAPRVKLFPPYDPGKDKPWLNLAMTLAIIGLIVWMFPTGSQLQRRVDNVFPKDALNFMEQHQIKGRLFSWYDYGGYVEFYAPEIKTFADGRTDIFVYSGVLDDYIKINAIDQPFELLDKYKIDYVLFPVNRHLTYVLDHSQTWKPIYEDRIAKLFQRVPNQ
jgi:hypothetical protein